MVKQALWWLISQNSFSVVSRQFLFLGKMRNGVSDSEDPTLIGYYCPNSQQNKNEIAISHYVHTSANDYCLLLASLAAAVKVIDVPSVYLDE